MIMPQILIVVSCVACNVRHEPDISCARGYVRDPALGLFGSTVRGHCPLLAVQLNSNILYLPGRIGRYLLGCICTDAGL
jgi:hypothetical protein